MSYGTRLPKRLSSLLSWLESRDEGMAGCLLRFEDDSKGAITSWLIDDGEDPGSNVIWEQTFREI